MVIPGFGDVAKLIKSVKGNKADMACVAVGGAVGLVVDVGALPHGIITGGGATFVGASAGLAAKTSFDAYRVRGRAKKARKRAAKAKAFFAKKGYAEGETAVATQLELYDEIPSDYKELNRVVDDAIKAYKIWVPPKPQVPPKTPVPLKPPVTIGPRPEP
jgi:hypothetical protein